MPNSARRERIDMNAHRRTRRTVAGAASDTPEVEPQSQAAGKRDLSGSESRDLSKEPLLPRDELMQNLREIIDRGAPAMVQSVVNQAAESGSYLPTRFLLEFAGLSAAPPPNDAGNQTLTALLLRSLGVAIPNSGPPAE